MLFTIFAVLFGFCARCVYGIGDNCQLAIAFTNSAAPQHLLQALEFDADVLINFLDFAHAQVELQNVRLNTKNTTFNSSTVWFLEIPFNVTFRYAKVNHVRFADTDYQYSKYIKTEIITFIWSRVRDTGFLTTCFQDDEPSNDNLALNKMPEINWVTNGFVTHVKNQNPCASCWDFATVGLLESLHMKKTGQLLTFSEQRLLSCGKGHFELHECESPHGGNVIKTLDAIRSNGTCLEDKDPWIGADGSCKKLPTPDLFYKNARFNIEESRHKTELPRLWQKGPVAGSVFVNPIVSPWDNCRGKDILKAKCPGGDITNHAILIVGSGTYKGEDYVLIKNSWAQNGETTVMQKLESAEMTTVV